MSNIRPFIRRRSSIKKSLRIVRPFGAHDTGRRIRTRGSRVYKLMSDDSLRRLDSNREIRRTLELSPRQFRKARRLEGR